MSKKPRIQVSLDHDDMEIIEILSKKDNISMSSVINRIVHNWLEEYEDFLLAKRVEDIENEWRENGCKTISGEEFWKDLDIE